MTLSTLIINSSDVDRSVSFYEDLLEADVVSQTPQRAVLDVVTGTIEVVLVGEGAPASTWVADDVHEGFRHFGFKVANADSVIAKAQARGVTIHLEPIEAAGDVRIAFFFDPDGTLVEVVERHLNYHSTLDADAVAREQALPVPERPRLDHVAITVPDLDATVERWRPLGYVVAGALSLEEDPRGFDIHYLHDGGVVIEVFTYRTGTVARTPQVDAAGFGAAGLEGALPAGCAHVGKGAGGHHIHADADGLTLVTVDTH